MTIMKTTTSNSIGACRFMERSFCLFLLIFATMASFSAADQTAAINQHDDRRLASTTLDFFMIWRIETSPIPGITDRAPVTGELNGVAEATQMWLTDILPTIDTIDAGVTVNSVTAKGATSHYNPSIRFPHLVSMNVEITFDAPSSALLPEDMKTVLSGIGLSNMRTFVYDYLRKSGGSDSLFQYSRDTATYVVQETTVGNTAPAPTPQLHSTPAPTPQLRVPGTTHPTLPPTSRPTARPTLRPVTARPTTPPPTMVIPTTPRPTMRPALVTSVAGPPTTRPTLATQATARPTTARPSLRPTPLSVTPRPTATSTSNTLARGAFHTTPVVFTLGGVTTARTPTSEELSGLVDSTNRFLQSKLTEHYATDPDISFVGVTTEWTKTTYQTPGTHVLSADIIMRFSPNVPTSFVDYYVFLLTDILQNDTSNFVLNFVRKSEPSTSIFRSVTQFAWDFRLE